MSLKREETFNRHAQQRVLVAERGTTMDGIKVVRLDGKPLKDGETVTTDHSVRTFTVQVRSMGTVSVDSIKDLIERRHEVVSIEEGDLTLYVRGAR